ncbi:hypothetical protein BS47DRAFT_1356462 [Hydnum rufescens UP504]|uniref:Uncharacterized protein n=1 Tax=Hydnum rufescens UP504 TaxID=1448309 RepID=A0A9P6ADD5_9AGAM|nr:hypothetical protein BS47DRAFT_1356462 [Hydnum rufescens UP504]
MEAAVRPLVLYQTRHVPYFPFWIGWYNRDDSWITASVSSELCVCVIEDTGVSRSRRGVHDSNPSPGPQLREYGLVHVGLLNGRGIENWLEIETTAMSTRGIVTFSPTNEALVRGAVAYSDHPVIVGDPGQSMSDLARWIEDGIQLALNADEEFYAYDVYRMFIPHSRQGVEPPGNLLYDHPDKLKSFISGPLLTDGEVRQEL